MSLLAYLVAIVLFLVAGFEGGIEASWQDFTVFGLAAFTLGHLVPGPSIIWPPVPR